MFYGFSIKQFTNHQSIQQFNNHSLTPPLTSYILPLPSYLLHLPSPSLPLSTCAYHLSFVFEVDFTVSIPANLTDTVVEKSLEVLEFLNKHSGVTDYNGNVSQFGNQVYVAVSPYSSLVEDILVARIVVDKGCNDP